MILLVTSKDDLTSDYLILRLITRQIPFFRLNTEDLLSQYSICLEVSQQRSSCTIVDATRNASIRSDEVTGAYFRKPQPPTISSQDSDPFSYRFHNQELHEFLRSTWRIFPKDRWLNDPETLWLASNKIKQLDVAAKVGLSVPPTIVSATPCDVLQFIKEHNNDVIGKAVKNGFVIGESDHVAIFTSVLDENDIEDIRNSQTILPMIVQPRLSKEIDLRITIVGDDVFSVGIDSQQHADTETDWRTWEVTNNVNLRHFVFNLPETVKRRCLELNRRLGLRFSCVDMVLSRDGEFIFLEVNPNGQWAWIEQKLQVPIRDRIIDELARCRNTE